MKKGIRGSSEKPAWEYYADPTLTRSNLITQQASKIPLETIKSHTVAHIKL